VSPKNSRSSMAHYSERLGRAMGVEVYSYNLRNVIGRKLVHVQFEYNLRAFMPFGVTIIPYLIALRLLRTKIVITLHCVYSIRYFRNTVKTPCSRHLPFLTGFAKWYIYLLTEIMTSMVHTIIVLNVRAKEILEKEYKIKKIVYIEYCSYGLDEKDLIPREEAKKKLGLDGKLVMFSFGELHPRKRYELVVSLLPMLKKRYSNILYLISKVLPSTNPKRGLKYLEYLNDLINKLNVKENVLFVDYIPEEELKYYFRASDVVIFSHQDGGYGSAASKHAMSYLSTMVISDVSCFRSLEDGVHCLKFRSKEGLFRQIVKALKNKSNFEKSLRREIEELSIENHAENHLRVYRMLLSGQKM
jgi:glycosyltransferase involved in cell wall biosynthesis